MVPRFLIYVIVALILILAIGTAFFVYQSRKGPDLPRVNNSQPSSSANTNPQNQFPNPSQVAQNRAMSVIGYSSLMRMERFYKGVLQESVITNTFRGELTRFEIDPPVVNNIKYALIFTIKGEGGLANGFSFIAEDLKKVNFLDRNNGPLQVEDFKVGDRIEMKITEDLLADQKNLLTEIVFKKL